MKTKNLNFNITWESKRKNFIENLDEFNFQFPTYDVIIKNEEGLLINTVDVGRSIRVFNLQFLS